MLAATGESRPRLVLLAIALQAEGMQAVSYAGWQVPIRTDSAHTKARIDSIDDEKCAPTPAAGRVVIVTGFLWVWTKLRQHHSRLAVWRLRHLGCIRGRGPSRPTSA